MSDDETESEKFTLTITKDTASWLRDSYPEATSQQERVRMAISDARQSRTDRDG